MSGGGAARPRPRGVDERERLRAASGGERGGQPMVEISLTVSYLQIYCEMLHDLLDPSNADLSVREKGDGQVYVEGLSRVPVTSLNQCLELLREGRREVYVLFALRGLGSKKQAPKRTKQKQ